MYFLPPLTDTERMTLMQYLTRKDLSDDEKRRFTAIKLSAEHQVPLNELASILNISRALADSWLEAYQLAGFASLLDNTETDRPHILPQEIAQELVVINQNHKRFDG